jgi:hypothetical protein
VYFVITSVIIIVVIVNGLCFFMIGLRIVIMTVRDCMTPSIPRNLVLAGTKGFLNNVNKA